jgi:hypothetical protein
MMVGEWGFLRLFVATRLRPQNPFLNKPGACPISPPHLQSAGRIFT